jgi:hypothetical protein
MTGPAITLKEPYKPRPIRFLELWREAGWSVKVYGIAYNRPLPRPEVIEAGMAVARPHLTEATASAPGGYRTGYLGIHDGRGANFVFFDFWADENELHHHVYVSPTDRPGEWEYVTPSGLIACVWDLRVMCFERQAWVDCVLANPEGPDVAAYLATRLNEDV